jgi:thymidylate synthase ThyX
MNTNVTILADSISPDGVRLTTMQTEYPRFIHSEMLRHRMFSHSVASSRAIPTEKNIERVRRDPFIPTTFNKRVKGMGVGEAFSEADQDKARYIWEQAAADMADSAELLNELGLDKSRANRLLEPFLYVTDIITATEWDNFFALRDHSAAQPEFQQLARLMREALEESAPWTVNYGEWHLPLTSDFPMDSFDGNWEPWKRISAGRCARVSFDKQNEAETPEASEERAHRLIASGHLSPFEHVARPLDRREMEGQDWDRPVNTGNFRGWVQMRKEITNEANFGLLTVSA